jgi:hypothetical protein
MWSIRHQTQTMDTIGQRASDFRNAPETYRANLSKLLVGYLLKGAAKDAARKLGLPRCDDGGRIVGKRSGWSQKFTTRQRVKVCKNFVFLNS